VALRVWTPSDVDARSTVISPARLALTLLLGLGVIAGCGQPPTPTPNDEAMAGERRGRSSGPGETRPIVASRVAVRDEDSRDDVLMSPGLHHHSEPVIRLYALEAWALDPGERLDPVTYALVDPDESVRARAQELLEEALARRHETTPSG
jgi:hypothetical protein